MPAATTNKPAYAVFDTAIGRCVLVWRGGLIIGAALPEADEERLRARLARRFAGAAEAPPPPFAAAAIALVVRLLAGQRVDLAEIELDLSDSSAFERAVYAAARAIPCGETRTYGELAEAIGQPGAAQAVGLALGRNPVPIIVPCHRILAASGKSGGFSAPGGVATKFRMLQIEGAMRPGEPSLFESLPLAVRPA
ncbi:MAG: methylated-DNA-[protein]-cysteine S-methyltransferase [Sphingomonadales bacterium]|jgi:methylated-DNA-[protein]-cysteine S-methyltransferase|nr:methylated-DNA-[protein]-cysteine S-methyltransferase [Sphingomonadales bacterium]